METNDIHPYGRAHIAFGTKHQKEQVVRPPFLIHLGAFIDVPPKFDTDQFGTFTGEVERQAPAPDVAQQKARLAMAVTGLPYGLASEGSFGAHPSTNMIPANAEWMVFIDADRGLTIIESELSTRTNHSHTILRTGEDPTVFLEHMLFPSHGVIARPNQPKGGSSILFKGLTSWAPLREAMAVCSEESLDGRLRLETDMRAHMNPTRQRVIQTVAQKMAKRLARACSQCDSPGWGILETVQGLPCESCDNPTTLTQQVREGCVACEASLLAARPDGLVSAQEQYCDACNP